jgi:hypothetical protein
MSNLPASDPGTRLDPDPSDLVSTGFFNGLLAGQGTWRRRKSSVQMGP